DVVGLLPLGELVRDDLRRTGRADPDHRPGVEAEPERVGDARDLEDALVAEPAVSRPHGRLRDAEVGRDPPERLAAVALERVDDPAVDAIELGRARDGAAPRLSSATGLRRACFPRRPDLRLAAQCEAFLPNRLANRNRAPRRALGQESLTQTCLIRVYSSIE